MESTILFHQVRQIIHKTSPVPSRFTKSPKNSESQNSPPTSINKITLTLQSWKTVINEPYDRDSAHTRIDNILNFFINIASSNNLIITPAVQTLRESLSVLRRSGDFSHEAAKKNWQERIAQLSVPKTDHNPVFTIRNLCLQGFPIFNIWDSISFIYTFCVKDIKTQLGAELHLYQFQMILTALRNCNKYFASFAGPTTVAASWKIKEQNQSLAIAFATTTVGQGKNTKEIIAKA